MFNLHVPVTEVFEDWFCEEEEALTCRRSLVRGPGIEKMGVASWHVRTLAPPYSLYTWTDLFLFTVEYGGRVAYMETHP